MHIWYEYDIKLRKRSQPFFINSRTLRIQNDTREKGFDCCLDYLMQNDYHEIRCGGNGIKQSHIITIALINLSRFELWDNFPTFSYTANFISTIHRIAMDYLYHYFFSTSKSTKYIIDRDDVFYDNEICIKIWQPPKSKVIQK